MMNKDTQMGGKRCAIVAQLGRLRRIATIKACLRPITAAKDG